MNARKPERRTAGRGTSLSGLQPIDAAPFKRPSSPVFIWFTILLVWLLSLLPWRLWEPAPDILMLVIVVWALNEPRRVGLFTAFFFGLVMDVQDGALLGGQAITYTIVAYVAMLLSRRLRRFNALVQAVHLLPVFMAASAVTQFAYAWLAGGWAGWGWAWSALLTVALWPLADSLLHMPQRRLNDADAGSV